MCHCTNRAIRYIGFQIQLILVIIFTSIVIETDLPWLWILGSLPKFSFWHTMQQHDLFWNLTALRQWNSDILFWNLQAVAKARLCPFHSHINTNISKYFNVFWDSTKLNLTCYINVRCSMIWIRCAELQSGCHQCLLLYFPAGLSL